MIHCDDLIDDATQPECLREFVRYNRLPAVCKCPGMRPAQVELVKNWVQKELHPFIWTDPEPSLFADYDGRRHRVVMVSRLGDFGITDNLLAIRGYKRRVNFEELSNFAVGP